MSATPDQIKIKRALVSVLRQDRPRRAGPGPRTPPASSSCPPVARPPSSSPSLGLPVTRVEDLTGFPEVPRRPREDAAPARPRRHPRRPPPARARRAARASSTSRPSTWSWSTSTRSPRPSPSGCRASTTAIEKIDIGGPSMVRAAAKNHAVGRDRHRRRRLRRGRSRPRQGDGFTLATSARRLAAKAFVHTATYDVAGRLVDGQRARPTPRSRTAPALGFPAWIGGTLGQVRRACATARTRTSPQRSTRDRPRPGRPRRRPSSCTARRCRYNNYVDTDAARRAAYDLGEQPTVAIIKHANPCGDRGPAPSRSPRPTAGPTSATRSPRSAA